MRKHFKLAAIAAFMALLMAVVSPMQAFAASQKLYISDIRMSESKDKLTELGYTVLDKDLNAGTSWYDAANAKTISRYTYIGYKTTTDPNEAITDISVMDMKGGYSFGDYEEMLKQQKKAVQEQTSIYRLAINEFRERYAAQSTAAKLAYTSLNNYIEDDSGKLIGDMFLDPNLSDDDLVKIFMQGSILINNIISECLAMGLATDGSENWLDRLSKAENITDDYYDDATFLLSSAQTVNETIQKYLDFGIDINDDDALEKFLAESDENEINDFLNGMTIYETLAAHKYKSGSVADLFMKTDFTYEDLYPIISVMTPGQIAIAKLNGFKALIKTADLSDETWKKSEAEYNKVSDKTFSDESVTDEKISIYVGIDRSMFKGGVALTSEAKRKSASTGDMSWCYGNMKDAAEYSLLALGGVSALSTVGTFAAALIVKSISRSAQIVVDGMRSKLVATFAEKKAMDTVAALKGVVPVLSVVTMVSFAILFVTAVVYFSMEVHNYYHPTYSDIPLILMDMKFGEDDEVGDWEKYIKYNVVCDENGNAGDLNAWMAKQWNAMYTTKDKAAGNPITVDSMTVKYGDSTIPRDFSPVHYFGSTDAFDLNSHCYNNDENGIFVFFQRDTKAFTADTASVFGSGALTIVTGFGGLIVGALGAVFITRKKKVTTAEV